MARPAGTFQIDGMRVELWERAPYEVNHSSDVGVIGFAFETQTGVDAIGSDRQRPFHRRVNTLAWIPPGCPVFSRSDRGGEYLVVKGLSFAIGHPGAVTRPLNGIVDPEAVAAANALRRMAASCVHGDPGAAGDRLAAVLFEHFAEGSSAAYWLTNARLAAIDGLIDAQMHEPLRIAQMAAELELSVGFLVSAFRQSLGVTPHRYLMERRLARARSLLRANHPIAAVAMECGFADQAHLTRYMKKAIGITPSRLRSGAG